MMIRALQVLLIFFIFLSSEAWSRQISVPLNRMAKVKTVELKCIDSQQNIVIPVPERWDIKHATINVDYVHSMDIKGELSSLIVKLNGYPLSQKRLDPGKPSGRLKLSIPGLLLEPGYNNLTFQVIQHYTMKCEHPCSPNLWTSLKLDEAFMQIEYDLKPVPLKLSKMPDFLFSPRLFPEWNINIVLEDLSNEMLSLTGIVASGIARKFDQVPVNFSMSQEIIPGVDNILIGKTGFVETITGSAAKEEDKLKGPFLKLMHLPYKKGKLDKTHALLVLSADDIAGLQTVAKTVADTTLPYPAMAEMIPLKLDRPDVSYYSGRFVLTPDVTYAFKNLDFYTHTFRGLNPKPRKITFRLPADFNIKPNNYSDIILNFSYSAGMRSDASLNIMLNNNFVRAINLDNSGGGMIEGYKVSIPTYLFRSGENILSFEPALPPDIDDCDFFLTENLFLTIFDNSSFNFPSMPSFIELPNIELFMLDGFPLTRWPDGRDALIYITSPDYNLAAAAMNIIGLMTQKKGYPITKLEIRSDRPANYDGEIIVLGDINSIPEEFKKNTPLNPLNNSTVASTAQSIWQLNKHMEVNKDIIDSSVKRGALIQFQSPYKKGRSVMLLTALTTSDLYLMTQALLDPLIQGESKGDFVLINMPKVGNSVSSMKIGKKYFTARHGKIDKIDYYLYTYPYLYYIIVILVIMILSFTIFFAMRRHIKKRLKNTDEN